MSVTSFSFLLMITIGGILYYLLPRSWQWIELLLMSVLFYFMAASPFTILYLVISTLTAYAVTIFWDIVKEKNENSKKAASMLIIAIIMINIALWFVFKGTDFWVSISRYVNRIISWKITAEPLPFAAALGMGYYTLQVIGYILDCYWGTISPQKNPFKLFLFVCFFPQMTMGPISRYQQLESLYGHHSFSYKNVSFGAQRILWGFFKKLVLAERVAVIVNGIWDAVWEYNGYYRWIALLLFPIQMYADFSGCMDIVIGTAEIFDIKLPENFNSPFFSKTVQEFWQRWHITLGSWAKDYILYPFLKSAGMIKISKILREKTGKKRGKFITTAAGMFVLWMVMGIWHGAFKYVVGVSIWYWALLMLGELCAPMLKKLTKLLQIPTESFSWHLFQSIRTYLIYAIGAAFFRAPFVRDGVQFVISLKDIFTNGNPWIFFDGSILELGVSYQDLNIIIFAVLLIGIADMLREKYGSAREWISKQIFVFRWFIWIGLFIFILIYGKYGPGYSAAEFIYQGF